MLFVDLSVLHDFLKLIDAAESPSGTRAGPTHKLCKTLGRQKRFNHQTAEE